MKKDASKDIFGKNEGNYIDKIIKENCQNMAPFIFEKLCGLEWTKREPLPETKQQVTREREPDFLHLIYNNDYPKGAVVHLEFETSDSHKMCRRMLEYIGILHLKTNKPVLQYVIYLGEGKARMKRRIQWSRLDFSFEVINIEDFSYQEFLNSGFPEGVIFSLIASHDDISVGDLTELIISQLVRNKKDKAANTKYINQLIMFARFRRLHEEVNSKIISMKDTNYFDVNTDIFYLRGVEQGLEQGLEQGIEQEKRRAKIREDIKLIKLCVELNLEDAIIAKSVSADTDFIEKVKKELLKKDQIISALKKVDSKINVIAKKLKVNEVLVEVIQDEIKKKN